MGAEATINVRLPKELKQSGARVLERYSISPTEIVRSVYRFMERNQTIPACLDVAPGEETNLYEKRRELLRSFDGVSVAPYDPDCKTNREDRIEEKYGDLL